MYVVVQALPPVLLSLEPLYKAQAKGRKDKLQPTLQVREPHKVQLTQP